MLTVESEISMSREEDMKLLKKELTKKLEKTRSALNANSLCSANDEDMLDGSDDVNAQIASLETEEIKQIKLALDKIERGDYGMCECCDTKISAARLHALPYAKFCIKCQEEYENSTEDSL